MPSRRGWPSRGSSWDRRDTGIGPAGMGGRARHDVVPVRAVRDPCPARHPGKEGDGGTTGSRAPERGGGPGILARTDQRPQGRARVVQEGGPAPHGAARSEEHTSELQSPCNLVCRLLLEKKKQITDERA